MSQQGPADRDLAPLADRLSAMQVLRLVLVAVVAVSALVGDVRAHAPSTIVLVALGYAALTCLTEGLRRVARSSGAVVVRWLVLVDGAWLAFVLTSDGGTGPLVALLYVHVVAVTLLVSYRAGLAAAAWHALLLFVVQTAAEAELQGFAGVQRDPAAAAVVAAALLTVAAVAAFGSELNERALRQGRNQLRSLAELGHRLELASSSDDVALATATALCRSIGFERSSVVTWRSAATAVTAGPLGHTVLRGPAGALGRDDLWSERQVELRRSLGSAGLAAALPEARNVVIVPLVVDGGCVGVVAGEWARGPRARLARSLLDTVEQAASHTALALRNAWLLEEVSALATRDGLTGLANRRTFEETLEREVHRARRTRQPLSLVVMDVDHFKAVNDNHGHQAGDAVLREMAGALAGVCRATDLPARYGGEEFVVLLPDCPADQARAAAERLRAAVAEGVVSVPVTVSAGVATIPDHAGDGTRLVAGADKALYRAKARGRDRSEVAASRRRAPLVATRP